MLKTVVKFFYRWKFVFIGIFALVGTIFGAKYYRGNKEEVQEKFAEIKADMGDFFGNVKEKYFVRNKITSLAETQGKHYGDDNVRLGVLKPVAVAKSQSGISQQASVAEKRIRKNAVQFVNTYVDSNGNTQYANFTGLMLYGRRCLLLRHYLETLQNATSVVTYFRYIEDPAKILNSGFGIPVDLLSCNLEYMCYEAGERDSNFVIVDLPCMINMFKDVTKFFATQKMHRYVSSDILFVRPGESTVMTKLDRSEYSVLINGLRDNVHSGNIRLTNSYNYSISCPGFCGSLIIDPRLEKPIIGMHVAGLTSSKCGIAEILTYEAFSPIPSRKTPIVDICEMETPDIDVSKIDIDTVIYVKGTVDEKHSASQSSRSQYVPSVIHGEVMPVLTEPMPLDKNDPRMGGEDPLSLGCSKHGLYSKQFQYEHVAYAKDQFGDKIVHMVEPLQKNIGVMSLNDACCGIEEIPEYRPLEWSSSEGFPLVKLRPPNVKGKAWLFDLELLPNGYKLKGLHPLLKRLLETQGALRKKGIRCDSVFIDCLKDETLPLEKARTPGKTRVFSTAPVTFVIAFRQYFGDFMAAYRAKRLKTEHAVGIDVNGLEWTKLANFVQECGPKIVAGDYSHYGYTLNSDVMMAAFQIMIDWYDKYSNSDTLEEDQIVRNVLANEIINCKRLARNLVYESLCGIPSGFPATDIINSMVNSLYVRLAWINIIQEPLKFFEINCRVVTYGDDLLMNVSDKYIERFNTETLRDFFGKYNIKFTDITKDGELIKYRTLESAPFLKRNFIKHPTRPFQYLAKIDPVSIGNALNWINGADDAEGASVNNAVAALLLAHGHGPEFYTELYRRIKIAFENRGILFHEISWLERDKYIYREINPQS